LTRSEPLAEWEIPFSTLLFQAPQYGSLHDSIQRLTGRRFGNASDHTGYGNPVRHWTPVTTGRNVWA